MSDPVAIKRIISRLHAQEDGCIVWTGSVSASGHGTVRHVGGTQLVHRILYQHLVGPIGEGMVIHHRCKNPRCSNPIHLHMCTAEEHRMLDDTLARRNATRTHCKHGHLLEGENLIIRIKKGKPTRQCRACGRIRTSAYEYGKASYHRVYRFADDTHKECLHCRIVKPRTEFEPLKVPGQDPHRPECRECKIIYRRNRSQGNGT